MDRTSECTENLRRVLTELGDTQSLFSGPGLLQTEPKNEENATFNIQLKWSKDENEFTKLKTALINIETKAKMIDFLLNTPPDAWPAIDKSANKENFTEVNEQLKKTKREAEHLEQELSDLIETIQERAEELDGKLKEAEATILSVEQKKSKLDRLKAQMESALSGLDDIDTVNLDVQTKLQGQREAIKSTEMALQKCELVLLEHRRAVCRLKEECCLADAVHRECDGMVASLRAESEAKERQASDQRLWMDECLASLRQVSGVSDITVSDQTVTLDLVSQTSLSPIKAKLKMTFSCPSHPDQPCMLTTAEAAQDLLDCSDVISECVATNDPVLLVTEVKRRLDSHAPILQEVEELRNRYAIDYVHGEGTLRAMLGSSGQVVCTLSIEAGYPTRGGIQLTKIEGNGHHKDLQQYQPPMANPSMSDWLLYLQARL